MSRAGDIALSQHILGFGLTTDMTFVIDTLDNAGIPRPEVTSFNPLTLRDGRAVLLVTNFSLFWPVLAIDEIPNRHDRVFVDDACVSHFSKDLP